MSNRFEPVKIAVAGIGNFGRFHAATLMGLAEAELVGGVGPDADSRAAFQELAPAVPVWADIDTALKECDAEAWIVATTTRAHIAVARQILEAGKHVLLEKPIADNVKDAESLTPLVSVDSNNLMMGHIVLFNSEFRELRAQIEKRGAPRYIDAVRHRGTSTLEAFPGESPFHLTMVHDLYCVQVLVNGAEPSRFSGQTACTPTGEINLALGQLQWDNGITASLTASFMSPPGMYDDGFDRLEVFGDGWSARLLPNSRPFELWDAQAQSPMGSEIRAEGAGPSGMMAEEHRCFCRVVRGLESVPLGARYKDAIQLLRWIDHLENTAC
jgi:predicted dehydrogenase